MKLRRSILLFAIVVAAFAASAAGATTVEGAAQFIRQLGDKATATLQAPNLTLDQREARFRGLLAEGFDLAFIGRFVLGRYWRAASPEQQSDYLALFSEFVVQVYSTRFGGYVGQTLTITGGREAGDKDVIVRTRIDRPSGPPIVADWRVRITGNQYRIIDVMVEGISMAVTQRSEFASVVRRDGIEGLLAVLRARTTKMPATASIN